MVHIICLENHIYGHMLGYERRSTIRISSSRNPSNLDNDRELRFARGISLKIYLLNSRFVRHNLKWQLLSASRFAGSIWSLASLEADRFFCLLPDLLRHWDKKFLFYLSGIKIEILGSGIFRIICLNLDYGIWDRESDWNFGSRDLSWETLKFGIKI